MGDRNANFHIEKNSVLITYLQLKGGWTSARSARTQSKEKAICQTRSKAGSIKAGRGCLGRL